MVWNSQQSINQQFSTSIFYVFPNDENVDQSVRIFYQDYLLIHILSEKYRHILGKTLAR